MLKSIPKNPNTDSYLKQIESILDVPGDIAECGVYKGYNTYHYHDCLVKHDSKKLIYAFDSFCGFPKDVKDNVDLMKFSDVNFSEVQKLFDNTNIVICKGFYDETLRGFESTKFSCVILDCDLYDSYKQCLEFFYPKMSPNGIIILDEYYSKKYPLARVAVDEFTSNIPEKPEMFHRESNGWERWRIVKH